LKKKYSDDEKSPVKSFIFLEKISSIKLIQKIDDNLKSIHGFISGTMLLSEEIQKLASQLSQQQVFNLLKKEFKFYFFNNKCYNLDPRSMARSMGRTRRSFGLFNSSH
jgi:hypothetical protein